MTTYTYSHTSPIEEIAIRTSAGGGKRAFVFAGKGMDAATAEKIREGLQGKHFSCVPSFDGDRPCLEIRGCKGVEGLEEALRPIGALQGAAVKDEKDNVKYSLREKFSHNMLLVYGVMNVIADVGILIYGHLKEKFEPSKNQWEDKYAGRAYTLGSLIFTAFGQGDKSDHNVSDLAGRLRKEMLDRGITLGQDSAAVSFTREFHKRNPVAQAKHYLQKHTSEIGNAATGTAGALILKGALKSDDPHTRMVDGILGASTMLGGYGAAIVKEKAPDPDKPPQNMWQAIKQRIQAKPNQLAGFGYMVSTVAHGWEAVTKYKSEPLKYPDKAKLVKTAYLMRGLFVVMNLVDEFILAMASKGNGAGVKSNPSVDDTVYAIVADAIVRQPDEKRDTLVRDLSRNFLARNDVLGGDPEAIESTLMARIDRLERSNLWARTAHEHAMEAAPAAAPAMTPGEELAASLAKKPRASWQDRAATVQEQSAAHAL